MERKNVRLYSFGKKWHAILFTRGMDSAVIKMFLEQILIYKISRLYVEGITTSNRFEALRIKVKAYEYISIKTVYLEKKKGDKYGYGQESYFSKTAKWCVYVMAMFLIVYHQSYFVN